MNIEIIPNSNIGLLNSLPFIFPINQIIPHWRLRNHILLTGLLLIKFQSRFNCDLITHLRAQIIRFSMNQVTMTNKAAPKKKMVAARRKE